MFGAVANGVLFTLGKAEMRIFRVEFWSVLENFIDRWVRSVEVITFG